VIGEAEVKSLIGIVVKGIKVVGFVRFSIVEEFEKVDVEDQGVDVDKDEFKVTDDIQEDEPDEDEDELKEVDEVLDVDEVDENLEVDEVGEVMVTVPEVPVPPGGVFVGELVVIVEVFVDPGTRVW